MKTTFTVFIVSFKILLILLLTSFFGQVCFIVVVVVVVVIVLVTSNNKRLESAGEDDAFCFCVNKNVTSRLTVPCLCYNIELI